MHIGECRKSGVDHSLFVKMTGESEYVVVYRNQRVEGDGDYIQLTTAFYFSINSRPCSVEEFDDAFKAVTIRILEAMGA